MNNKPILKNENSFFLNNDYNELIQNLKKKVYNVQLKTFIKANKELLTFYWELGEIIVKKQTKTSWGDGFLAQLSKDLTEEFPDMKGFSKRNLELIRKWYTFWNNTSITKQVVSQLETEDVSKFIQIPWGHNIAIISKFLLELGSGFAYIGKQVHIEVGDKDFFY